MTERLLQYIWQMQYFNRQQLTSIEGEALSVLHPGSINTNQGPDFLNGRIRVNDTTWIGNIELHILSSNWADHQHSSDANYNNIILHVVWLNDKHLDLPFPVLELQSKVSKLLLSRFDEMMNTRSFIACEKMISQARQLIWTAWKERLVVERLEKKAGVVFNFLQQNNNHWEETFWWMIARNFGISVNMDAFEQLARSLPLQILARHKHQLHQTEALIFGQANLINKDFSEAYPRMLKKEYSFYRRKYQLNPVQLPLHFLRMRPSNFPTVRLAQLARLVHQNVHLFSLLRDAVLLSEVRELLHITANDYWHYHYTFDEPTSLKEKNIGRQMMDTLIINTIVPMLFAYGQHNKEQVYKERALQWLDQIQPEKNNVTNKFATLGVTNKSAFDSQALLQLKTNYCEEKRCLDCALGNSLLKTLITPG